MNNLSNMPFSPVLDTSSGDIIKDFFNPALTASLRYDRGVGFFSASWLRLAAKGMTTFATNSGRARWVTSPILGKADGEALKHDMIPVTHWFVIQAESRLLKGRTNLRCGNAFQ